MDLGPNDDGSGELQFLSLLQDSVPSGLVPWAEGSASTDVFTNVIGAMAFVRSGRPERARRIFDTLAAQSDPCPDIACRGGLQDVRIAATGAADPGGPRNDYWIGANAFLLSALKMYERETGDDRYRLFVARLEAWLKCIHRLTPVAGIYAGFTRSCTLKEERHPEGSLDVYGALRGSPSEFEPVRASIKAWLDQEVWVSNEAGGGECHEPGPAIRANVPADLVSFGLPALGPSYGCLLRHAERLHYRSQSRDIIETFDRSPNPPDPPLWHVSTSGPSVRVDARAERNGLGHEFAVAYKMTQSDQDWWVINRGQDIDFTASPGFRLRFWLHGDDNGASCDPRVPGSCHKFDVKLRNRTGEVYWKQFPIDFPGWRAIDVRYQDFIPFGPAPAPLGRVSAIEFGFSSDHQVGSGEVRLGRVSRFNDDVPYRYPVGGFAAWEVEDNWLFVEGSAAMAAAYCGAGEGEAGQRQLAELIPLRRPAFGGQASGLPSWVTGGVEDGIPTALASAWFLLAEGCIRIF